jgi:hypothetical protein
MKRALLVTAVLLLAGCAATANKSFVKPGYATKIECLSVRYQIGPYGDLYATSMARELEISLQAHTQQLLNYNGIQTCGVGRLGRPIAETQAASDVMFLRSSSGAISTQYGKTFVTFVVDAEIKETKSGETVFTGQNNVMGYGDVPASRLLAGFANALAKNGLVSLKEDVLRYELERNRGETIND